MRWNETVTLEFVKLYLRHECLWNPAKPGYKIKSQRDKAYAEISTEFKRSTMKNLSIPEVKLKIKNLRTTYLQQVHKILKKSRPDSIYEPSLIWFQEMDRCMKHIPANRYSIMYNNEQIHTDESNNKTWITDNSEQVIDEGNIDPFASQTEDDELELKYDPDIIQLNRKAQSSYKTNRKKNKTRSSSSDQSDRIFKSNSITNSSVDSMSREDEFDIYGRYIASQLRKMDLQKALRLQLEIQSLVSEARIADISSLH